METLRVGYLKCTSLSSILMPPCVSGMLVFLSPRSLLRVSRMLRMRLAAAEAWAALGPKPKPWPADSAP